jgi:hypothetical protein
MEPKVQQFLLKLNDEKRELAMLTRDAILAASPKISETIKWNQLTFIYGKANLAFIYTYAKSKGINLGFFKAVELSDPKKLLEGTGKSMRHIKIQSVKKIPNAQIKKWMKEAIALEE